MLLLDPTEEHDAVSLLAIRCIIAIDSGQGHSSEANESTRIEWCGDNDTEGKG